MPKTDPKPAKKLSARGAAPEKAAASPDRDPYKLGSRKGERAAPIAKSAALTKEQMLAKLKGYIRMPSELYGSLPPNIHIKYLKAVPDDRGPHHLFSGFIVNSHFNVQYKKVGPRHMTIKLKAGFGKAAPTWLAPHQEIGYLYAKAPATSIALHNEILRVTRAIVTNVKKIGAHAKRLDTTVKKLERRVQALERRR